MRTPEVRGVEIEATGEAPTLSDLPHDPVKSTRHDEGHASRAAAQAILGTLSNPEAMLGLPRESLGLDLDGLLPPGREESIGESGTLEPGLGGSE